MWDQLPDAVRETFLHNAPTFADEQSDPDWAGLGLDRLAGCTGPALLSKGTQSPPWFATIVCRLSAALPRARTQTFEGAGRLPHVTHPDDYVDLVTGFVEEAARRSV